MRYEPQDFARCAGNPALEYCPGCKRNVVNAPIPPGPGQSWWLGPWVILNERCPNFREMKEE